jgi:hypothetical protein
LIFKDRFPFKFENLSAHSRDKAYQDRLEHLKSEIAALNREEVKNMTDDMVDKYCDPKNPVRVTFNDVSSAAYRIKGGMDVTPCTVRYLIDLSYLEKQISPNLSINKAFTHVNYDWYGHLFEKGLPPLYG